MNLQTQISPDLWTAVRRSYESQSWSNAVLDGVHHLSDFIRNRTGLQSDGTALAGQAFGGKSPRLRLNNLQSETDQSIQSGVEQLVRGLYQAIRNPRSHDRVTDSQGDADALLMFINYLLGIIGHAKTAFSLDEAVSRALDQDFVPNERYASLVVEEIPQRQRLQVGLAVFERCGYNNHERLKYFFRTLSEQISNDDSGKFFAAISESLRDGSDDENLRFVLQILHPPQWLELSEVARLRSENRLLKSFADGEVSTATGECTNGSLAMWSFDFWPHFILKKEFMKATIGLLNSKNPDALQYAVKFALLSLPSLADRPPWNLQLALASLIKSGSEEVYAIVKHGALWEDNTWSKKVTEALAEYSERLPSDEGDRPF